jgi:PAS domain S-box-containing protein
MERGGFQLALRRLSELLVATPPEHVGAVRTRLAQLDIALEELVPGVHADGRTDRSVIEHRGTAFCVVPGFVCPNADALATLANAVLALLERCSDRNDTRQAQERMDMLSVASFEGILVHVNGVVIDVNQRAAEMFGYTQPSEMLGPRAMSECIAPEDIPGLVQRFAAGDEGSYVLTGVRQDGSRFRAEVLSKQARLGTRPVRIAALRDVTERERTQQLLRESETRLRDLAEQAFDFVVIGHDGVIFDVGGNVQAALGYEPEQIKGRHVLDFVASHAREPFGEVIAQRRLGSLEVDLIDSMGEIVPVALTIASSTLDGQPVRIAGVRDLRQIRQLERERRKLEQQVERTQRLQSLGVLAGGIAHDFNNLLVGVLGNAELLLEQTEHTKDAFTRDALLAIQSAGRRAADLTSQMLAYAGQRELGRREPVDLGALCHELITLLDASLSKKARLQLEIEPGSVVLGDRATLTQLLMNLLTNASDALEEKSGDISVRMRRVARPDARWEQGLGAAVSAGDWLLIEVQDTGRGMDEVTRERAFEPFFTTKPKGHGLGLAASLGIVAAHRGAMRVDSAPGEGACFTVLLPALDASALAPRAEPAPRPAGALGRVLIVDDEAIVRNQMRRCLELKGYCVREEKDGYAALAALEHESFDVLLLDLTMPELDGAEVVRRLRAASSRIPIVLSSGYADVAVERRLPPGAFHSFLQKPFGVRELLDAVESALASKEASDSP